MSLTDWFLPVAAAAESSNNPQAANPYSSASGTYGFTDGTWNGVVKKYGTPYDLTPDGKSDPKQQERAARAITDNEYIPWFQQRGVQSPTPDQLYQLHFWGQPNYERMMGATDPDGDPKLSDVLGSSFGNIYAGNKKLFGNNPGITMSQAIQAVDGVAKRGGASPAPTPPPQTSSTQGASVPDFTSPAFGAPASPQAPQQGNDGFFSPANLLRFAAGISSGNSFGQGISAAAGNLATGMQQDQTNARANAQLGLDAQKTNAGVMGEASKLMEMGMNPAAAVGLVTGRIPADQAQQLLANMPMTGGKATKGDTFLTPDGRTIVEQQHPYGKPTLFDMNTNQPVAALPQGSFRAQDAYFRSLHTGEAQAENGAITSAMNAPRTLANLGQLESLIPQIATGGDILSTVKRNFTNLTGMPLGGNDQAAQAMASQFMDQLKVARTDMLRGFGGRPDLPMVKAVQAAGPNWTQNPVAMQAIINYSKVEPTRQIQLVKDWQNAAPQDRGTGYRAFAMKWEQSHPLEDDVRAAISGGGGPGASAPAGNRPPLSTIFGK